MSTLLNPVNRSNLIVQNSPRAGAGVGSEGELGEPERTTEAPARGASAANPEVVGRAVRRRFTVSYKQRILAEVDAAAGSGAIGRIIRREGLYSSHLVAWRKARSRSERAALEPKKRGPRAVPQNPLTAENLQLKRENAGLHKKLHTAELMIDLQKKVSQLLGITLPVLTQSDDGEVNS